MIEIGDLILIPTKNQSHKDWLSQRMKGIGGSDMGVLFNRNEYYSVTELFYEKLGRTQPKDLSANTAVHYGTAFEDITLRDSQYLDLKGKENNHVINFNKKNKMSSHLSFPYTVIHKSFPWLQCNIDGVGFYDKSITQQDVIDQIESGVMVVPDYIVEIKTMSEFAKDKYKDGINPSYPFQVKSYCLPFVDLNPNIYGQIYVWCYDQSLTAHHIELEQQDIESILTVSRKFQDLIDQGKIIIKEGYESNLSEDEIDQNLSMIHPEANSEAVSLGSFLSDKFLRKNYIRENETIQGTQEDIDLAMRSNEIGREIKSLNKEKTIISNSFKNKLVTNKARVIDCKDRGKISYFKRLTNTIK
jgi:predicted phage-related endonuclease